MGLTIHGTTESNTGNDALDARSFMELNIHGPLKAIRAMLQSIYTCQTRGDNTTAKELRCNTTPPHASHLFHKGIPERGAQVDTTIIGTRSTQQSRDHIPACAIPSRSRLCEATKNQNCGPVHIYITLAEYMQPPQRASVQNMHSGNPICHQTYSQNNMTR